MNEDDFKQAIRLLHVWQAWHATPGNIANPAREDALYPGKHLPHQTTLLSAASELLAKYPYEPLALPTPREAPTESNTRPVEETT